MTATDTDEGSADNSSASHDRIASDSIESRGISDVRASMLNFEGDRQTTEMAISPPMRGYIALDVSWRGPEGDVGILANLTAEEAEAVGEKLIEAAEALRSSGAEGSGK